jgi:Peptidase propeptide and YPEB domain
VDERLIAPSSDGRSVRDMNPKPNRKRIAVVIAGAALVTAGTVGAAGALSGDDDAQDRPIPAADLQQAEQAALEETGGGKVTGTEVDDEESKYEVEVTLDDGTQVDVQLDEDFQVVGTESDDTDDESGSDD